MKRAVALLLVLTVIGAAGLVCAHRAVGASAEAVEMYETVLAGDRAAAGGVEVRLGTECGGRLHWDNTLSIGAENTVTADFRFTPRDESEIPGTGADKGFIYLYAQVNTSGTADSPDGPLRAVVRDAASRTGPLESRTETVNLRDWFAYFPMYVRVRLPSDRDAENELERVLEKSFKISVPEDWQLDVRVICNESGGIAAYETYPTLGGAEPGLDCLCAVSAEGQVWLAVQKDSRDDGSIEYPGAGCLYSWNGGGELTRVLEFAGDERIARMAFDARGRLVMLVSRDNTLYLRVYGAGLECLQETELMPLTEDEGINRLVVGDNFLFAGDWNGRFALAELTEGGGYSLRLVDEMYEPDPRYVYQDSAVLRLWDGERLVMASALDSERLSEGFKGVILWVYDETGVAFCARYDSSQCLPETENWAYIVELERELSMRLR